MDPSLQSETPALKQKRSDSPESSCVSIKTDTSMENPLNFKSDSNSKDRQRRSDSPESSCVSIKTDTSMENPLNFKSDSNSKDSSMQAEGPHPRRRSQSIDLPVFFKGSDCQHAEVHNKLKSDLRTKVQYFYEGIEKKGNAALLNEIYTELYMTEGGGGEINKEHEIRLIEKASRKATMENTPFSCNDIFKPLPGQNQPIRTVLTKGVAGIGKTVSVQKFILDWAEGKVNQDVHLIFPLAFRELNLLKKQSFSLKDLLQFFMGTKQPEISPNECKIIFIFDGLDECRLSLDFQNNVKLHDVTESASVDVLLMNLIEGNLLPSALIWITSRPAAADLIPSECVNRVTEVQGFKDPQKEEYFRKRITDQSLADRIASHLKSSMSLYIMCQIPVFCWISATVLEKILSGAESGEIPKTLNQMYTNFLILQTNIKHEKDYVEKVNDEDMILKLGKLAFQELMKHNVIFKEEDLRECGIDVKEAAVYSGLCAQIGEEFGLCQRKVYCFVHLSIQEHLAALYVHHTFITQNINVFVQMTKSTHTHVPISDLHQKAVDETLESKTGHLGLFLRFLLGFSLESNQTLLKVLLTQTEMRNHNLEETVNYIKKKIEEQPTPEKFVNLFHCLNDLGDSEPVEQIQLYLKCRDPCESKAKCCAPLAVALASEYSRVKEMNLNGNKLLDAGMKLLSEGLGSSHCQLEILRLKNCGVTNEGCASLALALRSNPLHLKHLDLSFNKLGDKGVTCLSDSLCRIQKLKLRACDITDEGCAALASALTSNPSHLRELDLTKNNVRDVGVKLLSDTLKNPECQLKVLKLKECGLADEGFAALASALRSNPSHMKELNLSENELGDSGINFLANEPKCPTLGLEELWLTTCGITHEGCAALASALTSNLSQLKELNLSNNIIGDSGLKRLSAALESADCKLETLGLNDCGVRDEGCAALISALTSNHSHLRKLHLSGNEIGASTMEQLSALQAHSDNKLNKVKSLVCSCSVSSGCV